MIVTERGGSVNRTPTRQLVVCRLFLQNSHEPPRAEKRPVVAFGVLGSRDGSAETPEATTGEKMGRENKNGCGVRGKASCRADTAENFAKSS